jgi:hypothetical protein
MIIYVKRENGRLVRDIPTVAQSNKVDVKLVLNPKVDHTERTFYIYVYTTEADRLLNRYKVGMSTRHPRERIAEQDTTSNSSELIVIGYWKSEHITDKVLFNHLHSQGIHRVRMNREWFVFPGGEQQVLEVIPATLERLLTITKNRKSSC